MAANFKAHIDLGGSSKGATAAIGRTSKALGGLDTAQARYNSHLSRSNGLLSTFGATMSGVGMLALANDTLKASFAMDSFNTLLEPEQLEHLTEVAARLGISFEGSARAFALLNQSAKGTVLEGEGIVKVFDGIAVASRAVNLSADDMRGIFRAVEQMMNKGTVQAEELRGQLAERLPGAFQMSARAMGVTTTELSKMLETGDVIATELLPKLAEALEVEFGDKAEEMAGKGAAALQNFKNELFFLQADIMSGDLSGAFVDVMNTFSGAVSLARDDTELLLDVLEGLAVFMGGKMVIAMLAGERGLITKAAATVKLIQTNQALVFSNASVAASDLKNLESGLATIQQDRSKIMTKMQVAKANAVATVGQANANKMAGKALKANAALIAIDQKIVGIKHQITAATLASTVATKAATTAQRALSGAFAMMGGWPGLALAAGAGIYYLATAEEELSENTAKFLESFEGVDFALDDMSKNSEFAAVKLRELDERIAGVRVEIKELKATESGLDKFVANMFGAEIGSAATRKAVEQLRLTLKELIKTRDQVSAQAKEERLSQQGAIAALDNITRAQVSAADKAAAKEKLRTAALRDGIDATNEAIDAANKDSTARRRGIQEKEVDKRVTDALKNSTNASEAALRIHFTQLVNDEEKIKAKTKADAKATTQQDAATKSLNKYNSSLKIEIDQLKRVSGGLGDTSDLTEKIEKAILKHGVALDSLTVIQLTEIDRLEKLAEWIKEDADLYDEMNKEVEDAEKWARQYNKELDNSIAITQAKIAGDQKLVDELETMAEAYEIYSKNVDGSSVATLDSIAADIRKRKSLDKTLEKVEDARDAISDIFDNFGGNITKNVEDFLFQASFGVSNLKDDLKDSYDDDLSNLQDQLNSKKITQQEFDEDRLDLERDYHKEVQVINDSAWDSLKDGAILSVQRMLSELLTEWLKSKFLAAVSGFSFGGSGGFSFGGGTGGAASGVTQSVVGQSIGSSIGGIGASALGGSGQAIGAIGGAYGAQLATAISGGADTWFAANAAFGAGEVEAGIQGLTWVAESSGAAMSEAAITAGEFSGTTAELASGSQSATASMSGMAAGAVLVAGYMALSSRNTKKHAEVQEELNAKWLEGTNAARTTAAAFKDWDNEGLVTLNQSNESAKGLVSTLQDLNIQMEGGEGSLIIREGWAEARILVEAYSTTVDETLQSQIAAHMRINQITGEADDRAEAELAARKAITGEWKRSMDLVNGTKFDALAKEFVNLTGVAKGAFSDISKDGVITAEELSTRFNWSAKQIEEALGGAASVSLDKFLRIQSAAAGASSSLAKSFAAAGDSISAEIESGVRSAQGSIDSLEGADITNTITTVTTSTSGATDRNANKATGTPPGGLVVPAGFPSDTYTVGLTSGERYTVDTKQQQRTRGEPAVIGLHNVEELMRQLIGEVARTGDKQVATLNKQIKITTASETQASMQELSRA